MGHIIWQFVKWFAIGVVVCLIVMVLLSDLGMLGIAASGVLVVAFSSMLAALINASDFYSKYKDNPAQDIREEDLRLNIIVNGDNGRKEINDLEIAIVSLTNFSY